jgi:hypothetical protein
MGRLTYQALVSLALASISSSALADIELTLEQLPEPVRQTAVREVKTGQIVEIEQDDEDGSTVYEVEFVLDAVKYELDIAPDGTLLRRHRD